MCTFYASFYGQPSRHTLDRLVAQPSKLIKLNCQRINERMIRSDPDSMRKARERETDSSHSQLFTHSLLFNEHENELESNWTTD